MNEPDDEEDVVCVITGYDEDEGDDEDASVYGDQLQDATAILAQSPPPVPNPSPQPNTSAPTITATTSQPASPTTTSSNTAAAAAAPHSGSAVVVGQAGTTCTTAIAPPFGVSPQSPQPTAVPGSASVVAVDHSDQSVQKTPSPSSTSSSASTSASAPGDGGGDGAKGACGVTVGEAAAIGDTSSSGVSIIITTTTDNGTKPDATKKAKAKEKAKAKKAKAKAQAQAQAQPQTQSASADTNSTKTKAKGTGSIVITKKVKNSAWFDACGSATQPPQWLFVRHIFPYATEEFKALLISKFNLPWVVFVTQPEPEPSVLYSAFIGVPISTDLTLVVSSFNNIEFHNYILRVYPIKGTPLVEKSLTTVYKLSQAAHHIQKKSREADIKNNNTLNKLYAVASSGCTSCNFVLDQNNSICNRANQNQRRFASKLANLVQGSPDYTELDKEVSTEPPDMPVVLPPQDISKVLSEIKTKLQVNPLAATSSLLPEHPTVYSTPPAPPQFPPIFPFSEQRAPSITPPQQSFPPLQALSAPSFPPPPSFPPQPNMILSFTPQPSLSPPPPFPPQPPPSFPPMIPPQPYPTHPPQNFPGRNKQSYKGTPPNHSHQRVPKNYHNVPPAYPTTTQYNS
ncbi:hypothetical protein Pelo_13455 [Pelomyxa schiedti]|nr:hypothetical protein Pelo_13455 [Pelomyxa schiedti]